MQPAAFAISETKEITYTTTGSVSVVRVIDLPQGWTANVNIVQNKITVTAPAVFNADNHFKEVTVLVADDTGQMVMRTLVLHYTAFFDEGVIINGIKWATRNVDIPGTFAATPQSAGMFYQWSRKIGWSSTNPLINSNNGTSWDLTTSVGTAWTSGNDPSPVGWRVPTYTQIQTLLNTANVSNTWTTQNGVNGRLFTDLQNGNTLFLPAAGYRDPNYGTLTDAGTTGYYWSRSPYMNTSSYYLYFGSSSAGTDFYFNRIGFSVRPVVAE